MHHYLQVAVWAVMHRSRPTDPLLPDQAAFKHLWHTHTLTVALCPAAGDSSHALWLLCAACLPARPRRSIFINSGVNTSEAEFPPGLIASVASKIAFPPLSPHFRPYWPAKGSLSAAARRNCIKCAETVCRWDPDGWFARTDDGVRVSVVHALTQ